MGENPIQSLAKDLRNPMMRKIAIGVGLAVIVANGAILKCSKSDEINKRLKQYNAACDCSDPHHAAVSDADVIDAKYEEVKETGSNLSKSLDENFYTLVFKRELSKIHEKQQSGNDIFCELNGLEQQLIDVAGKKDFQKIRGDIAAYYGYGDKRKKWSHGSQTKEICIEKSGLFGVSPNIVFSESWYRPSFDDEKRKALFRSLLDKYGADESPQILDYAVFVDNFEQFKNGKLKKLHIDGFMGDLEAKLEDDVTLRRIVGPTYSTNPVQVGFKIFAKDNGSILNNRAFLNGEYILLEVGYDPEKEEITSCSSVPLENNARIASIQRKEKAYKDEADKQKFYEGVRKFREGLSDLERKTRPKRSLGEKVKDLFD